MAYPKNATTPPRIAIGPVVQISDGVVQTSGVSVVVCPEGGAETAGGGTISYGGSSNVVYYAPTQAETDYTAFVVTAYKTGCIPVSVTVVTEDTSTAGRVSVATNNDKSGYALSASGLNLVTAWTVDINGDLAGSVDSVTGAVGSVTATVDANVVSVDGGPVDPDPDTPDVNVVSMAADAVSAAAVSAAAVVKMQTGLATSTQASAIANNTIVYLAIPAQIEIPNVSDTLTFRIALHDLAGNMVAPDSTPTITLATAGGTSRASRLAAATNPSTGVYEWAYSGTSTDPEERLYGEVTVTEGGVPRKTPFTIQVFDQTLYRFTTDDRDALTAIQTQGSVLEGILGTPVATVSDDIAAVLAEATTAATNTGTIQTSIDTVSDNTDVTSAFLLNVHTAAVESPTGTYTWYVRNADNSANYLQVVYVKATGARTVTIL
jgi:hypothetical protein